jgi:hypothetical protein
VTPVAESTATPAAPTIPRDASTMTLVGRRRLLAEQAGELERGGNYPSAGVIVAGSSYSAHALRRALDALPVGYMDEISAQLNAAEDEGFRRAQRDVADAERGARLAELRQTEHEAHEREELLAAAQRDAAISDSVEARMARVEALLEQLTKDAR